MHGLKLKKSMVKSGLYTSPNEVDLRPKEVEVVKIQCNSTT